MVTALNETDTILETTVCEVAKIASPPDSILLCPWGDVQSSEGNFIVDEQAARAIIEAFDAQAVDLPIDWEHQTLGGQYAAKDGKAPAAGWIKALYARPNVGLFARVTWTPEGAGALSRHEYRYISPVLLLRRVDRKAVALHSVALTNKPAIAGMAAVINRAKTINRDKEGPMTHEVFLSELRELTGLGPESDEAAVLAKLQEMIGQAPQSVNTAGGLDSVDLTRFVARADHEAVCRRAEQAEQELVAMKTDAFIAEGMDKGKVTEHGRDMWARAFRADPQQAREDLRNAPVVAPPVGRLIQPFSSGRRSGPDRRTIINTAWTSYEDEPALAKLVAKVDFISGELVQAGLRPMTESEITEIAE